MADWKRTRLGASYVLGVQRRQVRVGRHAEPVVVVRLADDMKAARHDQFVAGDVRFAAIGMDYELRRATFPRKDT